MDMTIHSTQQDSSHVQKSRKIISVQENCTKKPLRMSLHESSSLHVEQFLNHHLITHCTKTNV